MEREFELRIKHIVRACRAGSLLLALECGSGGWAQSASLPAAGPASAAPAAAPRSAQLPARPAEVVYARGQFVITANNSSLQQILEEMARRTGMKITGSVSDERVYGMYGPATPARMIEILLDGAGTNMMLSGNGVDTPAQLTLTARHGGPTPPRPAAEDLNSTEIASTPVEPVDAPAPRVMANKIPPGSSETDSPNGMLTPQQRNTLMQQLQQQQQAAQPAPARSPAVQQ